MKVIVVGGGAAGMMAGLAAAQNGSEVTLLEKNEKLGKKLFITGKGRCNLTNACDIEGLFKNVMTNEKFLYSAFYSFSNNQTISFFEELGLPVKIERGERVFPASDRSSDVIRVLEKALKEYGVEIHLHTKLKEVCVSDGRVTGVLCDNGKKYPAEKVILALGGMSYPTCGADGDTWKIANQLQIKTKKAEPSLVPLETMEDYAMKLQGLSLKNVNVRMYIDGKKRYDEFGEMLFTHFGVSGPLVLSASAYLTSEDYHKDIEMQIDLKPALSEKQLDERILRDFSEAKNKQFKNSLSKLAPGKLIPVLVELSGINGDKMVNEITKEERRNLVSILKCMRLHIVGNRGFKEAIITRGGIDVKRVDPGTMESKDIEGLYFAGEMLDLDALTGGFNLQIAWSTGYLAGQNECYRGSM